MAAGDVHRKVVYHSEHGDYTGWVTDYQAGRDQGDHHIAGFTNAAGKEAGDGDTFTAWSVDGTEQGAFTLI